MIAIAIGIHASMTLNIVTKQFVAVAVRAAAAVAVVIPAVASAIESKRHALEPMTGRALCMLSTLHASCLIARSPT